MKPKTQMIIIFLPVKLCPIDIHACIYLPTLIISKHSHLVFMIFLKKNVYGIKYI